MVFCPNCGAQVEGRFCAKCGTAVSQPAPGAGAGASYGAGPTTPPGGAPNAAYTTSAPPAATGGMTDNVAGLLCYVLTFITGAIFLAIEPYNRNPFVRFHAWQAIFFGLSWFVIGFVISIVISILAHIIGAFALLGLFISPVFALAMLCVWLFLMYKAYNREMYMLPVIGPLAAKQANS